MDWFPVASRSNLCRVETGSMQQVIQRRLGLHDLASLSATVSSAPWCSGGVPEPLAEGRIDVGECIVQRLALALDPYPRKVVAQLPNSPHRHGSRDFVAITAPFGQEDKTGKGPFSVLQRLKGQDD